MEVRIILRMVVVIAVGVAIEGAIDIWGRMEIE